MSNDTSTCQTDGMTVQYLGAAEVAARFGLAPKTVRNYTTEGRMPEPDVRIGPVAGWTAATVDEWWANRPGRGARTDLAESKGKK